MRANFFRETYIIFTMIVLLILSKMIDFSNNHDNIHESVITGETEQHDSLYYRYHEIKDSITTLEQQQQAQLSNIGYSTIIGPFGCSIILEDSNKYFLVLSNYRIHADSRFYLDGNKYKMEYTTWDDQKSAIWKGHTTSREVFVRFVSTGDQTGHVLIPVGKSPYKIIRILTIILVAGVIILAFYILNLFMTTLWNIARGEVFILVNSSNLFIAGWLLLLVVVISNLFHFVPQWLFSKTIPKELYVPLPETLLQHRGILIMGLIFLLLGHAFRKGFDLQKQKIAAFVS